MAEIEKSGSVVFSRKEYRLLLQIIDEDLFWKHCWGEGADTDLTVAEYDHTFRLKLGIEEDVAS